MVEISKDGGWWWMDGGARWRMIFVKFKDRSEPIHFNLTNAIFVNRGQIPKYSYLGKERHE